MGKMEFDIFAAEGTYYEIGRQRALTMKEAMPDDIGYFVQSTESGNGVISARLAHDRMKAIEKACPGLTEEIEGFASEINTDPEKMVFYSFSHFEAPNCCQIFVSPEHTVDQCTYMGRSYEYYDADERSLCITRVKGRPKHMGFSLHNAGRTEGMNEYGLAVSMSSVMYRNSLEGNGVAFWVVIRAILENCRNVEDAVAYIRETPIVANCNFMVADAAGKAAVIEYASFAADKRKLEVRYPRFGLLAATNHYAAESMREFDLNHMWNSEVRYSAVWKELLVNAGRLHENGIKKILAKGYPDGPCCHYYSTGMGTIRSMVFNTTQKKMDVCFGATDQNSWTSFDFDYPAGITVFQVPFENETPEREDLFWRVYK
ncbi:MAG: linear amide C-N hydrolase [Ruminococcaceae bacterium]|nr:linear amide C-N hydrolase [Oscillospiraceae bacterium]